MHDDLSLRAKKYNDYIYYKNRLGSNVILLSQSVAQKMCRTFVEDAHKLQLQRKKRKKNIYSGVPNTSLGACCITKDFLDEVKKFEDIKKQKKAIAEEKTKARKERKKNKEEMKKKQKNNNVKKKNNNVINNT